VCVCVCVCVYIYTHTHTRARAHTHTHIHTYTHTHIHTYNVDVDNQYWSHILDISSDICYSIWKPPIWYLAKKSNVEHSYGHKYSMMDYWVLGWGILTSSSYYHIIRGCSSNFNVHKWAKQMLPKFCIKLQSYCLSQTRYVTLFVVVGENFKLEVIIIVSKPFPIKMGSTIQQGSIKDLTKFYQVSTWRQPSYNWC